MFPRWWWKGRRGEYLSKHRREWKWEPRFCQSTCNVSCEFQIHQRIFSYQEYDRNVQHECAHGIGQKGPESNIVEIAHGHGWNFPEKCDAEVHDGTNWSEIVEGYQWVHLELGRAEKSLDHDNSNSLEDDTSNLEQNTNDNKVNFSNGCDHNTDNNEGDVEEGFHVWFGNSKGPTGEQDCDRSGSLQLSVSTWKSDL